MELELIHADVTRALRVMPAESVDVVVTSPDYNLGVKYKSSQKVQQLNDYLAWAAEWGCEIMRVLKPGGSLFLNIAGAPSRPLLPFHLVLRFSEFSVLQNTFHWIKAITVNKGDEPFSIGHFKPLTSSRYVNDLHEYIFHFTKDGKAKINRKAVGVPYADKSNVRRWGHSKGQDLRCRGNTWQIPYTTIQSRNKQRPHPATFPSELALMAYRIAGAGPESVVMDPFVGLGSSGIAAALVPVKKFIGIDIEEFYVEESRKRINIL